MNQKTAKQNVAAKRGQTNKTKSKNKSTFRKFDLMPFLLLVLSVVVETCLIFKDRTGAVGRFIHEVLCGCFGAVAYLIPAGILMIAFCFFDIRRNKSMPVKSASMVAFTLFFAACQSVAGDGSLTSPVAIGNYYENGISGVGGGVVGGLIGKLMTVAFDKTFACVISILICLCALSFFVGAGKTGAWSQLFGLMKRKLSKRRPKPVSQSENIANVVKTAQPAEPVKVIEPAVVQTTVSAPVQPELTTRATDRFTDPFVYGDSFITEPPAEIDLREKPVQKEDEAFTLTSSGKKNEPIRMTSENPMTARSNVPLGKDGLPRAYSPFANPFVSREDILKRNSKKEVADTQASGKKRAYSPFADPLTSMEDYNRIHSDHRLPPQTYIACGAEYPASSDEYHPEDENSEMHSDKPYTGERAENFGNGGSRGAEVRAMPSEDDGGPQKMFDYTQLKNSDESEKKNSGKKGSIFGIFRRSDDMTEEYSEDIEDDDDEDDEEDEDIYSEEPPIRRTENTSSRPEPPKTEQPRVRTQSHGTSGTEGSAIKPDYYSPPFDVDDDESAVKPTGTSDSNGRDTQSVRQVYGNEPRYPDYVYPHFDLMDPPKQTNQISEEEIMEVRNKLLGKLASFKVEATLSGYSVGPTITRYELTPGSGVKVKQITSLIEDLSLELKSDGVRIATVPGKSVIGVEVPNEKVSVVSLRSLIENRDFINAKSRITVCVGLTVTGKPVYMDIDDMPHVLIAGETKSGKSVAINCMILSLLYRSSPDEVQLILIDPKRVELNIYSKIPHLVMPVIDDPRRAAAALRWAVNEMDRRYMLLDQMGVRNREEYCELRAQDPSLECMPQIIIVIDELADLMLQVREYVEELINRLAAMARACGIHLLVGTQRPSVDIITGLIKANIPARIAFKVSSAQDSRIILGGIGAEKLLGRGDMLYQATGAGRVRVQGAFVSGTEIKRITKYIIDNNGEAEFDPEILRSLDAEVDKMNKSSKKSTFTDDGDDDSGAVDGYEPDLDLLCRAIEYILETGKTSTNNIQRVLHVGFNRAADIVDALEDMGFLSPRDGSRPREVLVTWDMYEEWKMRKQL